MRMIYSSLQTTRILHSRNQAGVTPCCLSLAVGAANSSLCHAVLPQKTCLAVHCFSSWAGCKGKDSGMVQGTGFIWVAIEMQVVWNDNGKGSQ